MLSRQVLQRIASLPSRNSVKEQEMTSNLSSFPGDLHSEVNVSFALLQKFLKPFQNGLKVSRVPEDDTSKLLFLLPATTVGAFAPMQ